MLVPGQDFVVETQHGIIRCLPKNANAASTFKVLQIAVSRVLPQIPDAPAVSIEIDGIIGPSITLAVQVLAQRLANGRHQDLAPLAGLQPEEAVPAVAERAMEIAGYLDTVMERDPVAVVNPQTIAEPVDPLTQLKGIFTTKRVLAACSVILGIGAFMFAAAATDRRSLGTADRSSMLPKSDGTDEFDEDAYSGHGDDADAEDTMSDVDTTNAIDVEAVEVPGHAA